MSAKFINTINENSKPVYGYWGFGWLSPYWDAADWMAWHWALKAKWGQEKANVLLIEAWNASPFGAANIGFRTFDTDFKNFAKENGFYEALFTGVLGSVMEAGNAGADIASKAPTVLTNLTNAIVSVSRYIIPIAIIVLFFWLILQNKKTVKG